MPVRLNAEKEGKDLAGKYSVRGFPTVLFLHPNGEIMGRVGGYMPPPQFAEEMRKADRAYSELPKIEAALKERPDDGEANAKMACILAVRGKDKDAEKALGKAENAEYAGQALAQAYNAVGDVYQLNNRLDEAIGFFKKADAAAKIPADQAYAKVSLMVCYSGKRDQANARKVAEELLAMKDAPPEYVEIAKRILGR